MSVLFTEDDFEDFLKSINETISVKISEEDIKNLTASIARTKNFSEQDVINALEHYKKDFLRVVLWQATLKGMINLYISDDGEDLMFIPDKTEAKEKNDN